MKYQRTARAVLVALAVTTILAGCGSSVNNTEATTATGNVNQDVVEVVTTMKNAI